MYLILFFPSAFPERPWKDGEEEREIEEEEGDRPGPPPKKSKQVQGKPCPPKNYPSPTRRGSKNKGIGPGNQGKDKAQ